MGVKAIKMLTSVLIYIHAYIHKYKYTIVCVTNRVPISGKIPKNSRKIYIFFFKFPANYKMENFKNCFAKFSTWFSQFRF